MLFRERPQVRIAFLTPHHAVGILAAVIVVSQSSGGGSAVKARLHRALLQLLPPAIAVVGVTRSDAITVWASHHETTLLILLFALVGSLLHPELRQSVILTLCYSVAFLAGRDMFFIYGLPTGLQHGIFPALRMVALLLVSILTLSSAVGESFRPGSVWARRCYFAGAALYFMGTGFISYIAAHSWQGLMMMTTGGASMLGAVFAERIIEKEQNEDVVATEDETDVMQELQARHQQRLRQREWKDPDENCDVEQSGR